MSDDPNVYEARRGWTTRAIVGSSIAGPAGIAALVGFFAIHSIKLLVIGLVCLLGVANLVSGALSRRVALRVDPQGITLAGRGRTAPPHLPWDQVQTIVLYTPRNIPMLGIVKSYAGVPAAPVNPVLTDSAPTPDTSIPLDSWRVDFARLKQVVGEVAPTVDVLDKR